MHRKQWEFVYVLSALEQAGMLEPGRRGIGFAVGAEPLPSVFAKLGVEVLATDAPEELESTEQWAKLGLHSRTIEDLWFRDIVPKDKFLEQVTFARADMNAIPKDLSGFDFCWSSCAFEHLGSLKHGIDFVENSLACLNPGGVAVHTTEFNLDSNEDTVEASDLCLYRKRDIDELRARLSAAGHEVFTFNHFPGSDPIDMSIDEPPYSIPHLKLLVAGFATTSLGLIIRKG